MDPEPAPFSSSFCREKQSLISNDEFALVDREEEYSLSLSGPRIALMGLTIAIATIGIPLAAVLTDRPLGGATMVPTSLDSYGSNPSHPLSFSRIGQSDSRDPRGEQE